jgi:hypothetical protein
LVDDVAHQVDRAGVVLVEEIEELGDLAHSGAEMKVGEEQRAVLPRGRHGSHRVAFLAQRLVDDSGLEKARKGATSSRHLDAPSAWNARMTRTIRQRVARAWCLLCRWRAVASIALPAETPFLLVRPAGHRAGNAGRVMAARMGEEVIIAAQDANDL